MKGSEIMAYVDYAYYTETYKGKLDVDTATKLLEESSDDIDKLTYGRIRRKGFDNLTEFQQDRVKKAVCYQVDFVNKYGEYINMPITGFTAGDISMSFKKQNETAVGILADARTIDYLSQTGLTVRRL